VRGKRLAVRYMKEIRALVWQEAVVYIASRKLGLGYRGKAMLEIWMQATSSGLCKRIRWH
jgi:hypothetical protein